MENYLLLLFSSLILCLTLLYLKGKWPDIDLIDIYIIFLALHYGIYPFVRGLYIGKGVVYDSYNYDPLVMLLIFIPPVLAVVIIRIIFTYLLPNVNNYLKIQPLIKQWASVNNLIVFLLYSLLMVYQFVAYYKYGVKSHILPSDFAKIGKDLPYWFMSVRTVYHYLTLSIIIVLASKAALSQYRQRYFWMALIIIFMPFVGYYGRKGFVNCVVISAVIWLAINEKRIFRLKNLTIAGLLILSFFIASNLYETYRTNLQLVGVSLRQVENPISAALNFKATLKNLKVRPGTWEFNYLVLDRQLHGQANTTGGQVNLEGLKSAIPRLFWPDKQFTAPPEFISNLYGVPMDFYNVGINIFGSTQLEFGFFSVIIVPLAMILIIVMTAGLIKIMFNYPVFLWFISANILNFLINIEENQNELFFMLRYTILIVSVFILYVLVSKIATNLQVKRLST